MKPIKYTEVKRAIDRAKISINYRRDAQKAKKRYLDIKISRNNVTIDLEKVVYIEKRRTQCVFHLEDGVEIPISRKHYEPVKAMHMDKIYRLREEKNHSQNHS